MPEALRLGLGAESAGNGLPVDDVTLEGWLADWMNRFKEREQLTELFKTHPKLVELRYTTALPRCSVVIRDNELAQYAPYFTPPPTSGEMHRPYMRAVPTGRQGWAFTCARAHFDNNWERGQTILPP